MVLQLECYRLPFDRSLPSNHPVIRQSRARPPFDRSLRSNLELDVISVVRHTRFGHLFILTLLGCLMQAMPGPPEPPQLLRPMPLARVAPPPYAVFAGSRRRTSQPLLRESTLREFHFSPGTEPTSFVFSPRVSGTTSLLFRHAMHNTSFDNSVSRWHDFVRSVHKIQH